MKKVLLTLALASSLMLLISDSASAATGLCYYDTSSNYSSKFTNTDGTVVLNGWQTDDTPAQFPPVVEYAVVTYHLIGGDDVWNSTVINKDYPKSGSWYSVILSNIPSRSDLSVRVLVKSGYNVVGAGNAY